MKEIVLPPLAEEPPIKETVINTWKVENWRQLNKKEHGPVFEAGGYPWLDPTPKRKILPAFAQN